MTHEHEEFIVECEKKIEDYIGRKSDDAVLMAEMILRGELKPASREEIVEVLQEANSWVWMICRHNRQLYKEYCYRAFEAGEKEFFLARGKEVLDVHKKCQDE